MHTGIIFVPKVVERTPPYIEAVEAASPAAKAGLKPDDLVIYLDGEKDRATALIPLELVDDMHIVGTAGEVKEKVAQWEETGVTTLLLSCRSADEVRSVAELLA